MELNERAKNSLFEIDIELETKAEKVNEKYQLRKKHNHNIIMGQRKKRMLLLNPKEDKNIGLNEVNNNQNSDKEMLLKDSDILINMPSINNISNNNINMILECLNSSDFEKNKWAIFSLRKYFEYKNPEVNEYLILFENNIQFYLGTLLKKNEDNICIINEILYIIANLFSYDEIINKYQENYFSRFLKDPFLYIYKKCFFVDEEELIISAFIALKNILSGKNILIKNIFREEDLIYSILDIINKEKKSLNLVIIEHFVTFFRVIINGIKSGYIENKKIFYSIFDKIFIIYFLCDKKDSKIIQDIIILIINAFDCKIKDKNENENYLMIDYLFEENKNGNIIFINYFCSSLFNNFNFYLQNYETFLASLNLLEMVTENCTKYQIEEIFNCSSYNYNFYEILNNYFKYRLRNNSQNNKNEVNYIIKLLNICNNIIDADLNFALRIVFSKFFENLIIYFRNNLMNRIVVDNFLDTFIRLLGYSDIRIADNLFKRGIIYEGMFCNLLSEYNSNNNHFNEDTVKKICKIISYYLQIIFNSNQKDKLTKEDFLLCYNFKNFITNTDILLEDTKNCLLSLDYMKMI